MRQLLNEPAGPIDGQTDKMQNDGEGNSKIQFSSKLAT
jgi:hypothetical protein